MDTKKNIESFLDDFDLISQLRDIRTGLEKMESQFASLEAEIKFLDQKLEYLKDNMQGDTLTFHKC